MVKMEKEIKIRLPEDVYEKLKSMSGAKAVTMTSLIRIYVTDGLREDERKMDEDYSLKKERAIQQDM